MNENDESQEDNKDVDKNKDRHLNQLKVNKKVHKYLTQIGLETSQDRWKQANRQQEQQILTFTLKKKVDLEQAEKEIIQTQKRFNIEDEFDGIIDNFALETQADVQRMSTCRLNELTNQEKSQYKLKNMLQMNISSMESNQLYKQFNKINNRRKYYQKFKYQGVDPEQIQKDSIKQMESLENKVVKRDLKKFIKNQSQDCLNMNKMFNLEDIEYKDQQQSKIRTTDRKSRKHILLGNQTYDNFKTELIEEEKKMKNQVIDLFESGKHISIHQYNKERFQEMANKRKKTYVQKEYIQQLEDKFINQQQQKQLEDSVKFKRFKRVIKNYKYLNIHTHIPTQSDISEHLKTETQISKKMNSQMSDSCDNNQINQISTLQSNKSMTDIPQFKTKPHHVPKTNSMSSQQFHNNYLLTNTFQTENTQNSVQYEKIQKNNFSSTNQSKITDTLVNRAKQLGYDLKNKKNNPYQPNWVKTKTDKSTNEYSQINKDMDRTKSQIELKQQKIGEFNMTNKFVQKRIQTAIQKKKNQLENPHIKSQQEYKSQKQKDQKKINQKLYKEFNSFMNQCHECIYQEQKTHQQILIQINNIFDYFASQIDQTLQIYDEKPQNYGQFLELINSNNFRNEIISILMEQLVDPSKMLSKYKNKQVMYDKLFHFLDEKFQISI